MIEHIDLFVVGKIYFKALCVIGTSSASSPNRGLLTVKKVLNVRIPLQSLQTLFSDSDSLFGDGWETLA